jgi:hypothetical protein
MAPARPALEQLEQREDEERPLATRGGVEHE